MKPEELHAIASELGLQFDEDSRSIYGTQSGYLLLLHEADVKNQFRLSVSVSLNGNPADSEENELVWDEFKSESLPKLVDLVYQPVPCFFCRKRCQCANQRQLKSYRHL